MSLVEGYYFGRFQPPGVHHGLIVKNIVESNPDMHLTIGVANSEHTGKNQHNFLYAKESAKLFEHLLEEMGIENVAVTEVEILSGYPLSESIARYLKAQPTKKPFRIFSGSPSTLTAAEEATRDRPVEIVKLVDDDTNGPRARHIRNGLVQGTNGWHQMVAAKAYDFLVRPEIVERIRNIPDGEKRPWTKQS